MTDVPEVLQRIFSKQTFKDVCKTGNPETIARYLKEETAGLRVAAEKKEASSSNPEKTRSKKRKLVDVVEQVRILVFFSSILFQCVM